MSIKILVAPAGSGKTAHVINCICQQLPLSPVRVVVPDHLKAAAFRRRLAEAGGGIGIQVQTFYDLYADVLTLAQGPDTPMPVCLPPAVRRRLIYRLTAQLIDAGQVVYYAPLRAAPGFARLLADLFEELKRARIFPEALAAALAAALSDDTGVDPRLTELAQLYAAYQAHLIEASWADTEGQGWLAAIALEEDAALLADLALLLVDGFDEFNPTQLAVLRLLAERAAETTVTLTGDLERPGRLAHRRLARARTALIEALDVDLTPLSPSSPPFSPYPLVHLETNLFEPNAAPFPAGGAAQDSVAFLEAQNRAAEAREALRWLKARVVRDGMAVSDVALVARDVTVYRPFLEEVAAEFGLPLAFAAGAPLRANPAVAAILNALTLPLPVVNWAVRPLLDALSSPYFDWSGLDLPLRQDEADFGALVDRLSDVARAGQVVEGLAQWREAFRRLIDRPGGEEDETPTRLETPGADEGELAPRRPPTGDEATGLLEIFEAVVKRLTPPGSATLRQQVAWVEALIGEDPALTPPGSVSASSFTSLHVVARARANRLTEDRDVAALRAFKDVLRDLVWADGSSAGDEAAETSESLIPHAPFVAELAQAVDGATYRVPVEGDAILVASAAAVRDLTFDAVALVGLAEGDFPRAEREDVLLRESDRAWLTERGFPIEPRLQGDEASFFYQAVTRARRRLLLCRPYLSDDGQSWEPSPYWSAVRALFPETPVTHVRPTDPLRDPASPQEATQNLQPSTSNPKPSNPGDLSTLTSLLARRFGPERSWSSSKLETYAKCPLYFWAAYAMALEPRELPQAGFDVLILGSIYHLVLERLYEQVPDGDPERLRVRLHPVARQVYDEAPNAYGFRPTPLWERQREELTQVLRRTLEGLIEVAGEYEPAEPELAFGLRGEPPLVLEGEQVLRLRGYIDRVDRAPDGRLRVIDYKAGSTPISATALSEGERLQLPLYALAAEQALGAEVASGFYWHIGSARPSSLRLEKYEGGVPGAIETAVAYAMDVVAAVRAGQFAPTPTDGGCPTFCPAAPFCEFYETKAW